VTAQIAIRGSLMRGGTSKGLVFRAEDLPAEPAVRDAVLLAAMGSPDRRQIDGVGGAHPLTSKVAVVRRSERDDADVDYLFLQVAPDRPEVSDSQNCGNMLAAVGPFALEEGLVPFADGAETDVRIWMVNTSSLAVAHVPTEAGRVRYDGDARIDGVPGTAAPLTVDFLDVAGSTCGALLPTGNVVDVVEGVPVTCIDNGMPVVCVTAADLGVTGTEEPAQLEADPELAARVEAVRLAAGRLMGMGDVSAMSTPKVSLLSPPQHGGLVSTRTWIPRRVHEAIGVFGAVTVATACVLPGSVAAAVVTTELGAGTHEVDVEHPTGFFTVTLEAEERDGSLAVTRSALLRTARLLMRGEVMVPAAALAGRSAAPEETA
jgi:4-oxalomesaconate tautomerase